MQGQEIHCKQAGCLGSLERATTVFFEVSKSRLNYKAKKSKTIKFGILLLCACTTLASI